MEGYERRLRLEFEKLQGHKGPLVINLRGNPGGQSYRMELLWRHFSNKRTHLPYALVAKQSAYTARLNGRHYRGFRKRWVDKHLETSPEARYIHAMATMPVGAVDTLFFPRKHPSVTRHRGPVALLIDGESASASVSFAGAFQDHEQGPVFGEACMGPSNGTMGNPCLRRLPISGVFVSLSTAMYMAQPGGDWAQSKPIQPDILVPDMWRNHAALQKAIDEWNQKPLRTKMKHVAWSHLWGTILFMMGAQSSAQTFDFRMTESMKVAQEISSQLALDEFAASKLLEAALPWDACLAHWNAHRDSLESATISEDELLEAMIPVQTHLDNCRTERTRAMRASLDSLSRITFDRLSLPEKPRVLHFGLHNRLDCVVCKPENRRP